MASDRPQPPLTRQTAPTAFAIRNIADRKARGRLRSAATAEAIGAEMEWVDSDGWRYQLEAPPVVTVSPKDIERAAATVDLRVWDASNTLIFRDRIHAWDGFPLLVPDGTQHEETLPDGTTHRVDNFRESPLEAARRDLAHTVRVVTKSGTQPWVKDKPGTVSTFYASTNDRAMYSYNGSYASARTGSLLTLESASGVNSVIQWTYTAPYYYIKQCFIPFDTSALSGELVSSAVLSYYVLGSGNADAWAFLYTRAYDYGASIGTEDFRPTDGTSAGDTLVASIARASVSASAYNDLTSESGMTAAISTSGLTKFYSLISNAEAGTAPTGNNYVTISLADETGTTQDPKLVVTHAAATKPFRRSLLGVGY